MPGTTNPPVASDSKDSDAPPSTLMLNAQWVSVMAPQVIGPFEVASMSPSTRIWAVLGRPPLTSRVNVIGTVVVRPAVTVTGAPEELLLFAVGRAAHVDFEGDAAAVQAVQDASKGL